MTTTPEGYETLKDAAKRKGVHPNTFRWWVYHNKIPLEKIEHNGRVFLTYIKRETADRYQPGNRGRPRKNDEAGKGEGDSVAVPGRVEND